MRKILIIFVILLVLAISPAVANVPSATLTADGQPVDLGNLLVIQQGSGYNIQRTYELSQPIETNDYIITNIIVNATENQSVSYAVAIIDTGAPSAFTFSYNSSINPVIVGPNQVRSSLSFSTTDGGSDGVNVTALAPSAGIPVDSDGITEMQVTTVYDGTVRNNIGLDLGGPGMTFPSASNSSTWGPFSEGSISGPESATGWINIQIDLNFQGSGGGDLYTMSGISDITAAPVPNVTASMVGVFRPSTHTFYLRPSTYPAAPATAINWGTSTDLPVTGDWNGDGTNEVGVFRPSTHTFYLRPSTYPAAPATAINWGASTDLPVTGDWNGDGTDEVGVFRPSTHTFYLRPSTYPAAPATAINWGASTDLPVIGDWNGDGTNEVGVFRPSTHTFYLRPSTYPAAPATAINWGTSTDLPVTGDWNGDGTNEVGVFRPSTHTFYLRPSTYPAAPATAINWGASTDLPVTGTWV